MINFAISLPSSLPARNRARLGLFVSLLALLLACLPVAAAAQPVSGPMTAGTASVGTLQGDRSPNGSGKSALRIIKRRVLPLTVEVRDIDAKAPRLTVILPVSAGITRHVTLIGPQDFRLFGWVGADARLRQRSTQQTPPGHAPPRA